MPRSSCDESYRQSPPDTWRVIMDFRRLLDDPPTPVSPRVRHARNRRGRSPVLEGGPRGRALERRRGGEWLQSAGERLAKFSASSVLPSPLYLATCGYGNNGRVRVTLPPRSRRSAISLSGGVPSSTQRRSASICPTGVAPGPGKP